jgi:hypothetical protein
VLNLLRMSLTPTNWHGAKDCAIPAPGIAYCFSSDAQFAAFTDSVAPAEAEGVALPASAFSGACSGYTKIWNGTGWTGTGLAFMDYGYAQDLDAYVSTPFEVISWFSNPQRDYTHANNCPMRLWTGSGGTGNYLTLPADADSTNMGTAYPATSVELYAP